MDIGAELLSSILDIVIAGAGGYLTARRGKLFWLGVVILVIYIVSMAGVMTGSGILGLPPVLGAASGFLAALYGHKQFKKAEAWAQDPLMRGARSDPGS